MDANRTRRPLWIVAMAVVIVGAGLLAKQRLDAIHVQKQQTLCVHNLHFMANALRRYATDHDGNYPDAFSQLYPKYLDVVEVLMCPEAQRSDMGSADARKLSPGALDSLCSYELAPGRHVDDPPDTLLAWERGDHHGGRGHSVLYVDGRGGWEPAQAWRDGKGTQQPEPKEGS